MTNTITVRERAMREIANILAIPERDIGPSKRLREDLECESLELVELLMALEDEFAIEIPDEDLNGLKTVEDVLAYVERRVALAA